MHLPSWTHLHGAITHFPIAMLLAGILFDVGGVVLKKRDFRTVGFWMLVVAVLGSAASLLSGWMAGDQWFPGQKPIIFFQHRLLAFATTILAAILLLWRIKAKDAMIGTALGATIAFGILIAGVASVTGYLGGTMVLPDTTEASDTTTSTSAPATTASVAIPGVTATMLLAGGTAYNSSDLGCKNCHMINGVGGRMAPDLTHEGTKRPDMDWQIAHLKDPAKMKPGSSMPGYATTSPDTLKAVAAYLVSQK